MNNIYYEFNSRVNQEKFTGLSRPLKRIKISPLSWHHQKSPILCCEDSITKNWGRFPGGLFMRRPMQSMMDGRAMSCCATSRVLRLQYAGQARAFFLIL